MVESVYLCGWVKGEPYGKPCPGCGEPIMAYWDECWIRVECENCGTVISREKKYDELGK